MDASFENTALIYVIVGLVALPITGSIVPLLLIIISLMSFRMVTG